MVQYILLIAAYFWFKGESPRTPYPILRDTSKRLANEMINILIFYSKKKYFVDNTIVLLRDVFHIGLVIGPRPAVLAWGAAERQYSRPGTYN
jgi:hypothetical protein